VGWAQKKGASLLNRTKISANYTITFLLRTPQACPWWSEPPPVKNRAAGARFCAGCRFSPPTPAPPTTVHYRLTPHSVWTALKPRPSFMATPSSKPSPGVPFCAWVHPHSRTYGRTHRPTTSHYPPPHSLQPLPHSFRSQHAGVFFSYFFVYNNVF
jgi:hypothetical protein